MASLATAQATAFHVGLNVSDLGRSVAFYRVLFGTDPARALDDRVQFELEQPRLVLALYASPQAPGGPLNHVGLRLTSAEALVAVQRRLEEAGIATQRQEGVECCYARQTKFWVTDPDRTLWEIYTLEEDVEHSGFDDPPAPAAPAPQAAWGHRLTDPVPQRIAHADACLDEVSLEGTFNAPVADAALAAFLAEVFRVLKPGGRVAAHGLVSDRPFPGAPRLPGLASLVRRVPVETEAVDALAKAGFCDLYYDRLADIHCFQVGGVELREMRLTGTKPAGGGETSARVVMYKGPFEEVTDDAGTVYRRGERVVVPAARAGRFKQGPAADQFAVLPN